MSAGDLLNVHKLEGLDVNAMLDKVDEDNTEDHYEHESSTRTHITNNIHTPNVTLCLTVWSTLHHRTASIGVELAPATHDGGNGNMRVEGDPCQGLPLLIPITKREGERKRNKERMR